MKFSERGAKLEVSVVPDKYWQIDWNSFDNNDDEEFTEFRMRFEEIQAESSENFAPFMTEFKICVQDYGAGIPED